jgi:hypothetical protein
MTALTAVLVIGAIERGSAANGSKTSKTITFADAAIATATISVDPVTFGNTKTTVWFQFVQDGASAAVASSTLTTAKFKLTPPGGSAQELCNGLDTDVSTSPCPFTVPSGKRVQFTLEEPSTSIFRLEVTHKNATTTAETWTLGFEGVPTSPVMRVISLINGPGATFNTLSPTGACGAGCPSGQSCQAPCPNVCPTGQSCQPFQGPFFPWWKYVRYIVDIKWPPPGPPCLSCPPDWDRPILDGFDRVLVSIAPFTREGRPLGAGHANEVAVKITGGEAIGPVVDAGSGLYMQMIQHRRGASPRVIATAAGVTSEETIAGVEPAGAGIYKTLTYLFGVLLLAAIGFIVMSRGAPRTARG